jgi:hypothetical protein
VRINLPHLLLVIYVAAFVFIYDWPQVRREQFIWVLVLLLSAIALHALLKLTLPSSISL